MNEPEVLLIFDCDGVLIDSEFLASRVELERLAELGCRIDMEEYLLSTLGRTDEEVIWADWASRYGVELPADFVNQTRNLVAAAFERELQTIPAIEEALHRLPYPRCVASGSRRERLERNLKLTGLIDYFGDHYYSATQVPRGKPHPDLFFFAASRFGIPPDHCIVIEDSPFGVRAALAAGMQLLVFTGASHISPPLIARLREAGATRLFDDMTQLPDLIHQLTASMTAKIRTADLGAQ